MIDYIRVAKLNKDAILPTRKNKTDAGLDLYACLGDEHKSKTSKRIIIPYNENRIIPTKIMIELPKGYFGWITNKSSKDYLIGGGIVDEGFQGELLVKVINVTKNHISIYHGDAVAQLLILPHTRPNVILVEPVEILEVVTDRGKDGGINKQNELVDDNYNYEMDDFYYDVYRERGKI